jgi:hypothetical protein
MANFTAEERETSPSAGANPSAIGWKADIQCPLSGTDAIFPR